MPDQQETFARLRALHRGDQAFVMPNPWDAGSARLLASLGFEAFATTSAGYAFSRGKRDSFAALGRAEILENAAEIVRAVDLPVSADLEDGFGPEPETCAETIGLACDIGLVGGSFARAAFGALRRAAEEIRTRGSFGYARDAIPDRELSALMSQDQCETRRDRIGD